MSCYYTSMDLNVPLDTQDNLLKKIALSQKLGYEAVAINNFLPTLLDPPQAGKKKKAQQKPNIKEPDEILIKGDVLKKTIGVTRQPFKQYSRISMVLKSAAQAHAVDSKAVQSYDIVAVQPTSEETFKQACTTLNVDVITVDVTENLDYRFKRPTINKAFERGIHFELQYSPSLRDKGLRKYLISNAMALMFFCKGKNVILTSGCEKAIELRGPHDIANLGLLLNLSEAQAKDSVTRNCRAVLKHSEARRIVRSVLTVTKAESLPESDSWIREKCNMEVNPVESGSDKSDTNNEESDSDINVNKMEKTENRETKGIIDSKQTAANENYISLEVPVLDSISPAKKMKTS